MTREEFLPLWAVLTAAYPTFPASDATLAIYARQLEDEDTGAMISAIDWVTKNSRFFPTIAELRTRACLAPGVAALSSGRINGGLLL